MKTYPCLVALVAVSVLVLAPPHAGGQEGEAEVEGGVESEPKVRERIPIEGGESVMVIDTSGAPELTEWVREKVVPMTAEWYPKLCAMLPSDGYSAPAEFVIEFDSEMGGVAATSGTRIRCSGEWMSANRDGEAVGAIFHELVHVVQQYGRGPRIPRANRPPGWLVEGIADYLRWFVYEPESRGAEIAGRRIDRVRYDNSYRVTANFLNWLCETRDKDLVVKLNAAIRDGRYHAGIWEELAGQDPEALDAAWKEALRGTEPESTEEE